MEENILSTIGNTNLLKLNVNGQLIYAKTEFMNPSGSIKDRIARFMVEKAEEMGELQPGMTIIEATAGNTGTSFAMVAAVKGYDFVAVMPSQLGGTKKQFIKAFGQKIQEVGEESIAEAKQTAIQLGKKQNYWCPRQFSNPDNPKAQEEVGRELAMQIQKIDVFVAGVGTGGTLLGTGQALQQEGLDAKIIAVEPKESPILTEGTFNHHKIEGIAEGFLPKIYKRNRELVDEVIQVKSKEAVHMAKRLSREKGLPVGVSSGANVLASVRIAEKGLTSATVLPDRRDRYLGILF